VVFVVENKIRNEENLVYGMRGTKIYLYLGRILPAVFGI
jgi:hypothetical protein